MSLSKFNENVNNVQSLPDQPTLTAAELKAIFDKAGIDIKNYINNTLTTEVDTSLGSKANSSNVYTKTEVDTALSTKANTSDVNSGLNSKAPTSHASTASTYGLGNHNNYGHVKAIDNTDRNVVVDGEALGAYQGYWLKTTMNTYNYNLTNRCNSLAQAIDDGDNALRRMINNLSEVPGDFNVRGRLFVDNSPMRSKYTYDNETVTNNPNMYITSNGWIRRTTGSSKRWKKDITEDIEERLNPDALYNLKIKQFKYKDECISDSDVRKGKNILGFIAEDVAEIYEPAVQYDENGQVEMWNAQVMIPALLKLIQEQNERIKVLEEKVLS